MQPSCRTTVSRRLPRNTLKIITSKPIATPKSHKMAFFPRNYYGSDASFTPLFRLLEDFDTYSREGRNAGSRGRAAPFEPKFDVRELGDHFHLHGEIPGLNKKDVSIEFTDPHTLRIHGRVERSYNSGSPAAGLVQDAPNGSNAALIEGAEQQQHQDEQLSEKSHKATVEDEDAETNSTAAPTPATTVAEVPKKQQVSQARRPDPFNGDKAKYWVSERSIGEFSRVFNFPGQIQRDAVSASLQDGILNITIPKAPKYEARRIEIN